MTDPSPSLVHERLIRLIVADIDGCLSGGSRTHFSPAIIDKLVATNLASRRDPTVPAVTFCTGRPQPYVECLLQVTHGVTAALCEGGTVLFDPVTHEVEFHEDFGREERIVLERLRLRIEETLVRPGVMPEPGKATHVTVLVTGELTPADLLEQGEAIRAEFGDTFVLECSHIAMHFLFRHLNKGTGIRWLSSRTGIDLAEMAGMGDAPPDVHFMRHLACACAPANAFDDVKRAATHVSALRDAEAAIEFIDAVVRRNRVLAAGGAATTSASTQTRGCDR